MGSSRRRGGPCWMKDARRHTGKRRTMELRRVITRSHRVLIKCSAAPAHSAITRRQAAWAFATSEYCETTEASHRIDLSSMACFQLRLFWDENSRSRPQTGRRGESWGEAWQRGVPALEPTPSAHGPTESQSRHTPVDHQRKLFLRPLAFGACQPSSRAL